MILKLDDIKNEDNKKEYLKWLIDLALITQYV